MKKKKPEQQYRYLDDPWAPSIENEIEEIKPIKITKENKSKTKKHKKIPIISTPTLPPVWGNTNSDQTLVKKLNELKQKNNILKWAFITSILYLLFFMIFYCSEPILNVEAVRIFLTVASIVPCCVGLMGMLWQNKKESCPNMTL